MKLLKDVFEKNAEWAESVLQEDPHFFERLSQQQTPEYLYIGCADSRVPANTVMGLEPGQVFVHRNVANLVVHSDLNVLSVLQYAVEVLRVKHVIICGHYGCGGVTAAMTNDEHGLIDNWLRAIKDVYQRHQDRVDAMETPQERVDLMCELNIAAQVLNVTHTTIVQDAWKRGQELAVHGWIYSLKNGRLKDLDLCISSQEQIAPIYRIRPGGPG